MSLDRRVREQPTEDDAREVCQIDGGSGLVHGSFPTGWIRRPANCGSRTQLLMHGSDPVRFASFRRLEPLDLSGWV
jgi:hypothetical protein